MADGLDVAAQAAGLLPRGHVKVGADLHPGAPRLTIVCASACGTADAPQLEVVFKSSLVPERDFKARFSEVPYDTGSFAETAPIEVCTYIQLALLEAVETNDLETFTPDESGIFVWEY